MAKAPRLYDLVLLLTTEGDDAVRAKILSDVESIITGGGGEITRDQDWGRRPMTYEIDHQADAEYHLLQFTGPVAVLESLEHNLRIADPVVRFRIIKVVPGTPEAPEAAPPVLAGGVAADADAS